MKRPERRRVPGGRHPAALACVLTVLAGAACGGDAGSLSVSTGPRRLDGGRESLDAGSPRPRGGAILPPADDEIVLDFGGAAVRYPIAIEAEPRVLDVHLSIDTSASIGGEIDQLQRDLQREIAPRLRTRVPGVSFGVSRFEDFPEEPFGAPLTEASPADTPYRLLTPITSDTASVESAVASLDQPLGWGGDLPESGAEALWQIATGEGYFAQSQWLIEAYDHRPARGGGSEGGVGFRAGALRVVLHVTDAPSHRPGDYGSSFPGTHSLDEAAEALRAIGARLVGIVSGACDRAAAEECDSGLQPEARAELQQVAVLTRALGQPPVDGACPYGIDDEPIPSLDGECPLVFDASASGEGLSQTLVDAIVELVDGVRFEHVTGSASDDPLGFVQRVAPVEAEPSGADAAPAQIGDLLPEGEPDGEPDSFVEVHARTRLRFEVELRNTRIAPLDADQRFRIVIQVVGDGLILEERTLRIRIPGAGRLVPPDVAMVDDAGG